ncbi:cyclic AMP-dependent transcription factor ATF-7 [Asbolus verrucosus]|uniref:Cyclic AMP-dependent transcription factor ATF-7 n=1 Tax=Asbolus verrucosus TaxID=1661398 RepID=A0A482VX30_ASBVE|nr:cyclic AMP-dependent transcription factor ATF-7 [Asbolus verrucosus]
MNESQKPFACTIEGCEMTFTNEDHLNWHHKKHDMVLNLGLASKNMEVADQTPTPTRFIRNCEEVGLFQDLQNVNPFDETFKKAIESAKSGTLHVPEMTSNDDTLHTPHIFPHVENNVDKYIDARSDNQSTQSNDFCINNVPSIQENNESHENYDLTIVTDETEKDNDKNKHIDLKNKLKETIKNKGKNTIVITPVPLERLQLTESEFQKRAKSRENDENIKKQKTKHTVTDDKAKIREMNRAAQLRCRKRKQIQWKKMEEELKMLKSENAKLNYENQNIKHKFYALKELLVKQKNDDATNNTSLVTKIEEILNSSNPTVKNTASGNVLPINRRKSIKKIPVSPIVPVPIIQNPGQSAQKPVLIQVMGSVAQLAVSVLPNK